MVRAASTLPRIALKLRASAPILTCKLVIGLLRKTVWLSAQLSCVPAFQLCSFLRERAQSFSPTFESKKLQSRLAALLDLRQKRRFSFRSIFQIPERMRDAAGRLD